MSCKGLTKIVVFVIKSSFEEGGIESFDMTGRLLNMLPVKISPPARIVDKMC